jgi:hypothetical protein
MEKVGMAAREYTREWRKRILDMANPQLVFQALLLDWMHVCRIAEMDDSGVAQICNTSLRV